MPLPDTPAELSEFFTNHFCDEREYIVTICFVYAYKDVRRITRIT